MPFTLVGMDFHIVDSYPTSILPLPVSRLRKYLSHHNTHSHVHPRSNRILLRFGSILFTRFILNLRSINNGYIDPDKSLHYSSINLAISLTSNIGAPLELPGFVGPENVTTENQIEATIQQQIDNPLSIGILETPRACDGRYVLQT